MMGEKLESVSITAYRGREFYGRCSKLTISTLSESYVWGKKSWKREKKEKKKTDFENLDNFWFSKEIIETRERVRSGDNNGRMLNK